MTFILVATFFIGQQVCERIMQQDNVSNLSHILDEVTGAAVGYRLNKNGGEGYSDNRVSCLFFCPLYVQDKANDTAA